MARKRTFEPASSAAASSSMAEVASGRNRMRNRPTTGPANISSSILAATAGRFGISVPYTIISVIIWITPSLMNASRIGEYSGPRRIRSRPMKYWEIIINAVTPRNRTASTTRSCLWDSVASLDSSPATDAASRQRSAIRITRSDRRLPSASSVPGLSLSKTQTITRPKMAARAIAAALSRCRFRSWVSPVRLAIVPSTSATGAEARPGRVKSCVWVA